MSTAAVARSGDTGMCSGFFDGLQEGVWMKRWRSRDCHAAHTTRPYSHWRGFCAAALVILFSLIGKQISGRWLGGIGRQRHQDWWDGYPCIQSLCHRSLGSSASNRRRSTGEFDDLFNSCRANSRYKLCTLAPNSLSMIRRSRATRINTGIDSAGNSRRSPTNANSISGAIDRALPLSLRSRGFRPSMPPTS